MLSDGNWYEGVFGYVLGWVNSFTENECPSGRWGVLEGEGDVENTESDPPAAVPEGQGVLL